MQARRTSEHLFVLLRNSVQHELEKFSSEKDYDTETTQKIEAILDESTSEWTAVREQVREGEISVAT